VSRATLQRVARVIGLEGVAVGIGLGMVRWPAAREAAEPFLPVFPYVIIAAGVGLGLRFGRGRLFWALIALALAERAVALGPASAVLVSALLPANLAAVAFVREDAPFGRGGQLVAGVLLAQAVGFTIIARFFAAPVTQALSAPWFPVSAGDGSAVPQVALLCFAVAIVILGIRALTSHDSTPRGLLWAAAAGLVALHAPSAAIRLWDFSTAGLAVVLAMVEASYALAFNDELTGLPGRRAFDQALARLSGPRTVAMVDVDHFKSFNDRYGHEVGDQVLKLVAGRLAAVGGGGKSYRYGGEEFVVIFPGSSIDDADPHLETLRASIEATEFTLRAPDRPKKTPAEPRRTTSRRKRDVSVTVSIGAATTVDAADKALYKAKHGGRNRVVASR
jgi:diguanylate cyclase (GGDEF)-like protein